MRIGIDAKRAVYNSRGLGNYSRDLIRILTEQHPENSYLLFYAKKNKTALMNFPTNCQTIEPSSPLYRRLPSMWRSFGIPLDYHRQELDIYHGLSNEIPYQFGKNNTRTVLTMHDLIFLKFPELYPWIDQKIYRRKYLSSCKRADQIISISNQTKQDLLELTNLDEKKVVVIHQGCNPIFRLASNATKLSDIRTKYSLPDSYILTVGAIEERKNQMLIVKSLHQNKLDLPLIIVGKSVGSWQRDMELQISKLGLSNQVHFLNDVPNEDLPAIYQCSSLFVYPSLYEGFGIPLLEALNSGIPVISSRGSCLEEAGGPGSLYIDPNDSEELAMAIKLVLFDTERRKQMILAGYDHADLFSDKNIADKVNDVYLSLK